MAASRGSCGAKPGGHLFGARRRPGLVVDDGEGAVVEPIEAVRPGGEHEGARRAVQGKAARRLAGAGADPFPAPPLHGNEPTRDAFESGPPEGPDPGSVQEPAEGLAPGFHQKIKGVFGQVARMGALEFVQGPVDEGAVVGGARVGVDGVQGLEAKHVAGIDAVGIAHPGLDLGHR